VCEQAAGTVVPRANTEEKKEMTNRHTLKFSIFAAAILALSLPVAASAQWGRYPQDRYPDNRGNGRYDGRDLRDSVHRLDRLAKDFERDMDRALDRSRANGSDREDRVNDQVHRFRDAVGNLKSRVGNGRDLDRSANEARRVLQEGQQLERVARRFDTGSRWSQIEQELRFISNVYGFGYNGGYGRDDDGRRNGDYRRDRDRNRNDDWWRRIPFPR
jgi:Rad3-related DNA helicase